MYIYKRYILCILYAFFSEMSKNKTNDKTLYNYIYCI